MTYIVYIFYSTIKAKYYVGYTGVDLQERIRKHNSNHKGFTGGTGDWKIVYTEKYSTEKKQRPENYKSKVGKAV